MSNIDMGSGSYKVSRNFDTRNNWISFMLVSKYRYKVFRKQSIINACIEGFQHLEKFGFRFGKIGFGINHVHLSVDIPKGYSVRDAEIMLKKFSAQNIFHRKPNFRKRYPRGSFWSGYEHHQSIGVDREIAEKYIVNQTQHHNVTIVRDAQTNLLNFYS